jgi:hypothetical protein
MPKIRLVKITHYTKSCRDYYDYDDSIVQSPMSDWQEVSEEDLEKLKYYLSKIKPKDNIRVVVYQEDETPPADYIKDINAFIENENEQIKLAEQKAKQAEKKREEILRLKRIEKAKKILEENS